MTPQPQSARRPRIVPTFAATLAAFFVVSTLALADDITLKDGTVFKDAKVIGHDQKSVTIRFASGVAMVDIAKVPRALVHTYDIDRDVNNAIPPEPTSEPIAGTDDGPVVDPKVKAAVDKSAVHATEDIAQIIPGEGFIGTVVLSYSHLVTTPHSESRTVNAVPAGLGHTPVMETTVKTWTSTDATSETIPVGIAFVEGNTEGHRTGETWEGNVWPAGTEKDVDEDGDTTSIPKFTTQAKSAYRYYTLHPDRLDALPKDILRSPVPSTSTPVTTTTTTSVSGMNSDLSRP
jgi:hypothetical protein